MAGYHKQGLGELQYDYLQSLIKTHNAKLVIIESKFKENISKVMSYIKENYIAELESQIKLRDKYIDKIEIARKIKSEENSKKLKSVEDLKKEYANKLPIISNKTVDKINKNLRNSFLDKNLPPISSNIPKDEAMNLANNVNSILSEVRMMSHNLSKLEMNQLHNHIKQDRIKRKADFLNLKDNQREKLVQIRNFSNAIRVNNKISLVSNNNMINTTNQQAEVNNNSAHIITPHINTTNIENNLNKENNEKSDNKDGSKSHIHEKVILEHKAKIKKLKVNEITNFIPIRKLNDSVSDKSSNRSQLPSGEHSGIAESEITEIPKHNNFAEALSNIQKYTVSDDEGVRASKRNIHDLKEIRRRIKEESTSPKLSKELNLQLARLDRITSSKRIDIPNIKDNEYSSNNKKREGSLFNNDKAKLKNLKKTPFKI
jgi:hypothetical protein